MIKSKATVGALPRPKGYVTSRRNRTSHTNKAKTTTTAVAFSKGLKRVTHEDNPSLAPRKQPSYPAAGMTSQLNRTGGGQ